MLPFASAQSRPSPGAPSDGDVVLTLALSDEDEPFADLRRFQASCRSLFAHNPSLPRRLQVALLLVEGSEDRGRAASVELAAFLGGLSPRIVATETLGRCFNEALRWVRAPGVRYWLHWDDAHVATRPFWEGALAVLERPTGRDVWLLRLSEEEDASDVAPERRVALDGCTILRPHPDEATKRALDPACYEAADPFLTHWPSFTLSPALHRAQPFRDESGRALAFEEAETTWPELQWRFGLAWETAGGLLAEIEPSAAKYGYYGPR